jgi:hypothetical protein
MLAIRGSSAFWLCPFLHPKDEEQPEGWTPTFCLGPPTPEEPRFIRLDGHSPPYRRWYMTHPTKTAHQLPCRPEDRKAVRSDRSCPTVERPADRRAAGWRDDHPSRRRPRMRPGIECEECSEPHAIGCSLSHDAVADLWLCPTCADDCGFCSRCGLSQLEQSVRGERGWCRDCRRQAPSHSRSAGLSIGRGDLFGLGRPLFPQEN